MSPGTSVAPLFWIKGLPSLRRVPQPGSVGTKKTFSIYTSTEMFLVIYLMNWNEKYTAIEFNMIEFWPLTYSYNEAQRWKYSFILFFQCFLFFVSQCICMQYHCFRHSLFLTVNHRCKIHGTQHMTVALNMHNPASDSCLFFLFGQS